MLRMRLVGTQRVDRVERHDQHQVPAAGIVQFVATDLETANLVDRVEKGQHALAEGHHVCGARSLSILQEDVVFQHRVMHGGPVRRAG